MSEVPGIDQGKLVDLQAKGEDVEQEIVENSLGTGWFMPYLEDELLKEDKDGQKVYDDEVTKDEIRENFVKKMIPVQVKFNDKSDQPNDSYLLQLLDVERGDLRLTPINGNMAGKITDLIDNDDICTRESFTEDGFLFSGSMEERFIILRYCGKLNSVKKNDSKQYHTWTGSKV